MDRSASLSEIRLPLPAIGPVRVTLVRDAQSPERLSTACARTRFGSAGLLASGRTPACRDRKRPRSSAALRHPQPFRRYLWPYRRWQAVWLEKPAAQRPQASDVSFVIPRLKIFAGSPSPDKPSLRLRPANLGRNWRI